MRLAGAHLFVAWFGSVVGVLDGIGAVAQAQEAQAPVVVSTSATQELANPRGALAETEDGKVHKVFKLPTPDPRGGAVGLNPLAPVVKMASEGHEHVQKTVRDYSCIMVRRERVDGRLGPHEFIYAKVRNRRVQDGQIAVPFSVYLKFLKPTTVAGREVLYVEGQNDGEMFARRGGRRFSFVTTRLDPHSDVAMHGNRYPITEFGIENLLFRLREAAQQAAASPCDVKYLPQAKINGRKALGIIVTYKQREVDQTFYQARIYIDDETQLPLHFESYDWPDDEAATGNDVAAEPPLLEQYTYTQLKTNLGFTDDDFSADNPNYQVK